MDPMRQDELVPCLPKAFAGYIARRFSSKQPPMPAVVDVFFGAAVIVTNQALVGNANVISVELDFSRITLAKDNAIMFEVDDKWADCVYGNASHVLPALNANPGRHPLAVECKLGIDT